MTFSSAPKSSLLTLFLDLFFPFAVISIVYVFVTNYFSFIFLTIRFKPFYYLFVSNPLVFPFFFITHSWLVTVTWQPHLLVKKKNVMCYYGADSPLVTSWLIFFASVFFAIIFTSNSCYSQSFSLSNLCSSLLIYPLKNTAHQLWPKQN